MIKIIEIERKEAERIGKMFLYNSKKAENHKHNIYNLEYLNLIKNGTIEINPQIKSQIESLNNDICPFCLNQINWNILYESIVLHNKIIKYLNKELAENMIGRELDAESELSEEEKNAIKKGKQLIKLYEIGKLDLKITTKKE